MFRILNKNIFFRKNAFLTFKQIYGIGNGLAEKMCVYSGLRKETSLKLLSSESVTMTNLRIFLRQNAFLLESNLRRRDEDQIQNLIGLRSYRGNRHSSGYPVRGQRTHTNAKTWKRKKRRSVKKSVSKIKTSSSPKKK
jgi:small subunit ribosomal protein S13